MAMSRPSKRRRRHDSDDRDTTSSSLSAPLSPRFSGGVHVDGITNNGHQTEISPNCVDIETDFPLIDTGLDTERLVKQPKLKEGTSVLRNSSIYVDAFNLALDTVLEEEMHLFNEVERRVFDCWKELSYGAQYIYVRLFLRKTAAWHRINTLDYTSDIANKDAAIGEIQKVRTFSEKPIEMGEPGFDTGASLTGSFTFADKSEDRVTTLEEACALLRLDELKSLAKESKFQGKNKPDLIKSLLSVSHKQTSLPSSFYKSSKPEPSLISSTIPSSDIISSPTESRDTYFIKKIFNFTGPCVRLTLEPLRLFERVHLVFHRSVEWTEKSLTTIILARFSYRNFPPYVISRNANVFTSRNSLLEFESALRVQDRVDNILDHSAKKPNPFASVLDIFEGVYPRWRELLMEAHVKDDNDYLRGEGAYLRRLSPAWVYTRIAHKATYCLCKLKEHQREHELLIELLSQRLFHVARRGSWYQRKAIIEEHYMVPLMNNDGRSDNCRREHWKKVALQTCEHGLEDSLVHLMYHYDLQKRITKLERALKIPKREQHDFSHVRLATPVEVTIEGTKIEGDTAGRGNLISDYASGSSPSAPTTSVTGGGKTTWLDPLDSKKRCTVEVMCLSHYRLQGWKGYHSEGGIIRTLFAYLFFDVLFSYVPNVFQSPYQSFPLDLYTDAFYPSRLSEINQRLMQIENGEAGRLIKVVWNAHYERRTCIVGLNWEFEIDNLLEIVNCFNGQALAMICKLLAQEYRERGGGVPDLFLWHLERKKVMFSEVKSEKDRLSDTQRLWIDVLTGAGVRVELCKAVSSKKGVNQCNAKGPS